MTSLPGAECGIDVELFDMCYRVRLDHSHFTVLLLSSLLGRLEKSLVPRSPVTPRSNPGMHALSENSEFAIQKCPGCIRAKSVRIPVLLILP